MTRGQLKTRVLFVLGLATYWPMLSGCKGLIRAYTATPAIAEVLSLSYFGVIVVLAIVLHALGTTLRPLTGRRTALIVGVATTVLLLPAALKMTMPGTVASITLGAMAVPLSAATFCLLTVTWGRVSLSSGYGPLRQGLPVDIALSFFLGYTIPALLGDVAGEAFRLHCLPVLRALWPLLSSLCLLSCLGDGDVDATGAPLHLGKRSGLMPIVALFILLASVLIGAFGGITSGDEDGLLRRHVITGSSLWRSSRSCTLQASAPG